MTPWTRLRARVSWTAADSTVAHRRPRLSRLRRCPFLLSSFRRAASVTGVQRGMRRDSDGNGPGSGVCPGGDGGVDLMSSKPGRSGVPGVGADYVFGAAAFSATTTAISMLSNRPAMVAMW
ncbi:hypothetical protein ACP70R_027187 [Stipagrostis hirtigluma subsp. patula]